MRTTTFLFCLLATFTSSVLSSPSPSESTSSNELSTRSRHTLPIVLANSQPEPETDSEVVGAHMVKRSRSSKNAKARKAARASASYQLLHGKHKGDGTYFGVGLGACGKMNSDRDYIVAASRLLYDTYPGATKNPNNNPICGRRIKATSGGKSVIVKVVDRCVGCKKFDLDFSPAAFRKLASMSKGRLHNVQWKFI